MVRPLVLSLLLVYGPTSAAGPPLNALTIAAEKGEVPSGADIIVSVVVTNTAAYEITFFDGAPECDYVVEIRDAAGDLVPDTPHKRELKGCEQGARGRNILVHLKPGESYRDTPKFVVNRLGDMTTPQKYSVQFMRRIPKLRSGWIKSQIIEVKVTPSGITRNPSASSARRSG